MKIITEPKVTNRGSVIEKTFMTREGYFGVCLFTSTYSRCGYVGVPEGHVLHGSSYDDLYTIDVHGGLTFSDYMEEIEEGPWFLGFDCGHIQDERDVESAKRYGTYDKANDFTVSFGDCGIIRTLDYVVEQVELLSEQLTPEGLMEAKIRNSIGR